MAPALHQQQQQQPLQQQPSPAPRSSSYMLVGFISEFGSNFSDEKQIVNGLKIIFSAAREGWQLHPIFRQFFLLKQS
jgi:hypothetical protein